MIATYELMGKLRKERRYWMTADRTPIIATILTEIDVFEKMIKSCKQITWVTVNSKKINKGPK